MRKQIGIIGTGYESMTLGHRFRTINYNIMVGMKSDPYHTLLKKDDYNLCSYEETIALCDIIIFYSNEFSTIIPSLRPNQTKGKIFLDLSHVKSSWVKNEDKEIAKKSNFHLLGAYLVTVTNMISSDLILDPNESGDDSTLYVIGNNSYVKKQIIRLLKDLGFTGIVDIKDTSCTETTDLMMPLWASSSMFNNPKANCIRCISKEKLQREFI